MPAARDSGCTVQRPALCPQVVRRNEAKGFEEDYGRVVAHFQHAHQHSHLVLRLHISHGNILCPAHAQLMLWEAPHGPEGSDRLAGVAASGVLKRKLQKGGVFLVVRLWLYPVLLPLALDAAGGELQRLCGLDAAPLVLGLGRGGIIRLRRQLPPLPPRPPLVAAAAACTDGGLLLVGSRACCRFHHSLPRQSGLRAVAPLHRALARGIVFFDDLAVEIA